ncbi:hypothetical protein ACP70R_018830 [Stipagrostis hirtigluma subsp. patula]
MEGPSGREEEMEVLLDQRESEDDEGEGEWYGLEAAVEASLSSARGDAGTGPSGGGGWDIDSPGRSAPVPPAIVVEPSDDGLQEAVGVRAATEEGTAGGASPSPVDFASASAVAAEETTASGLEAEVGTAGSTGARAPLAAATISSMAVPAGPALPRAEDSALVDVAEVLPSTSGPFTDRAASRAASTGETAPVGAGSEAVGSSKRHLSVVAATGGGGASKRARMVTGRVPAPHPNKSLVKGGGPTRAKLPTQLPSAGRGRGRVVTKTSATSVRAGLPPRPLATSSSAQMLSTVGPTEAVRVTVVGAASTMVTAPVVVPTLPPPPPVASGVRPAVAFLEVDAHSGFHLGRVELPRASGQGTFTLDDPAENTAWTVAGNAIDELARRAEGMAAMARKLREPLQGARSASITKSQRLVEHTKALQEVERLRSELEEKDGAIWRLGGERSQLERDLAASRLEEKRLRSERNKARDDAHRLRAERDDLITARDRAEEAFQSERDARSRAERDLDAEKARREQVEGQCASLGAEVAELGALRASATRVCESLETPPLQQGGLPARLEDLVLRVRELEEATLASGAGTAFAVMRSYYDGLDLAAHSEGFAGWCTGG